MWARKEALRPILCLLSGLPCKSGEKKGRAVAIPKYDYSCRCGLTFEAYAGFDDRYLTCLDCGKLAERESVYRDQFISCDTGPKGGQKVEPPREEKSYRHEFKRFQEASQEIDYAYSRVDDPKVKAPNYYKMGVARAQAFEARHRGKRKITD